MVKSLLAKMEDGKTVRIHLKKPYVGTQADFQDAIGKILADVDIDFDSTTEKIFSPTDRILQALNDDLNNLTYEKYLQENPDSKKCLWKNLRNSKVRRLVKMIKLLKICVLEKFQLVMHSNLQHSK